MDYALNFRTFLFSHYFYTGLRVGTGVVGLTLLTYTLVDLRTAIITSIGALCTSLMDQPSPLRHKFNEMMASALLCPLVALLVGLCSPYDHWLNLMLILITFVTSMMVAYGKKTMPLQFAALFMMILTVQAELTAAQALQHAAVVLGGGLAYVAYSMCVSWFLRRRIKQQVLAEALFELARYVEIKACFYDTQINLHEQFNALVRQQIRLADSQQASRDLILRTDPGETDAVLVRIHYSMLDLYEMILSTHTDYALLRRHFADHEVLAALHDIVARAADDIGALAYDVTRKRAAAAAPISYDDELHAIEMTLQSMEAEAAVGHGASEALVVLRSSWVKVRDLIEMIGLLRASTLPGQTNVPVRAAGDMTPFMTQQRYEWRLLVSHLRWDSPVFRFALRLSLAVAASLVVAAHLPYESHAYWLILSIVVILKPSFSMTRQRRTDRVIGTLIGCVLAAAILRLVQAPVALIGFLFIASVAAPAFLTVKYRYTAIAVSTRALLQIHLISPADDQVIAERLLDTVIGAAIATLFSFVLPSWEYRSLPQLMRSVLRANQAYIAASRDLLQGKTKGDYVYRLARKRFMESLAGLSSGLVRMLDEPQSKQRAVEEINEFVVQNYLVVAHVAAIRLLMRHHMENVPKDAVDRILQRTADAVESRLVQAQTAFGGAASAPPLNVLAPAKDAAEASAEAAAEASANTAANTVASTVASTATSEGGQVDWSGWGRLVRRTGLLEADVLKIAARSEAIVRALR